MVRAAHGEVAAAYALQPNMRLKLAGRGGRMVERGSPLMAAAPARSLSATRYTAAATMTKALWLSVRAPRLPNP